MPCATNFKSIEFSVKLEIANKMLDSVLASEGFLKIVEVIKITFNIALIRKINVFIASSN